MGDLEDMGGFARGTADSSAAYNSHAADIYQNGCQGVEEGNRETHINNCSSRYVDSLTHEKTHIDTVLLQFIFSDTMRGKLSHFSIVLVCFYSTHTNGSLSFYHHSNYKPEPRLREWKFSQTHL